MLQSPTLIIYWKITGRTMSSSTRKLLVTYALTYANGPLHLGHMTGFIQTDIWVRFQKMQKNECHFICGADSHGTPIMIQAEKLNIAPEVMIENIRQTHIKDLKDFHIGIDNYHTTHSPENRELTEEVFKRHQQRGNITRKKIRQAYDPEKQMFLSDRLIKGNCPRCKAADQYGDNCEACGATYAPTELINPRSTLSGSTPIEKESEHYFFCLTHFEKFLHEWTRAGHLQEQVTHKLDEWFKSGLKEWDISRDAPYFGFNIPGEPAKYFYCWLDAPIGYMASFKNYCAREEQIDFDEFWQPDSTTELYHFIGKDIIYFHALFWPAVLKGADFRTPTKIFTHGFLTIDGQKMSKSRGTFILARTFLDHFNPDYLRYYLATRLNENIEDLDFQFDDFMQRINSDLVGKFVNIASRSAKFIQEYFSGKLSSQLDNPDLFNEFAKTGDSIAEKFNGLEYNAALREIMGLADLANQYIDQQKPWKMIKEENLKEKTHAVCSMGIQLFRQLAIYLKPILPGIISQAEDFLNCEPFNWSDKNQALIDHSIKPFKPLATRIDKTQFDALNSTIKT